MDDIERLLSSNAEAWNAWRVVDRRRLPQLQEANLAGRDLRGYDFESAFLEGADLSSANLCGTRMTGAFLSGSKLDNARLDSANLFAARLTQASLIKTSLRNAKLKQANFREASLLGADLSGANVEEAHFFMADLRGANLRETNFVCASLFRADLRGADLTDAILIGSSLVDVTIEGASFVNNQVYGLAAWDLKGEPAQQQNLLVTLPQQPEIRVDDLTVAQFVYLILDNKRLRGVIETLTSKAILILGRFSDPFIPALKLVQTGARANGYVPIMFDFSGPTTRSSVETVKFLAGIARFVVADLSDARSVLTELQVIVPDMPSIPIQPIRRRGEHAYGMLDHFDSYDSVLPVFEYTDQADLSHALSAKVFTPAEDLLPTLLAKRDKKKARAT